jgi:hypothetical protein
MPKEYYVAVRNYPLYFDCLNDRLSKETDELKRAIIKKEKERIISYYQKRLDKKKEELIELSKILNNLKSK